MSRPSPYRPLKATLVGRQQLSSSMIRITLTGPELHLCSPILLDQRIKIMLGESAALNQLHDHGDDWYGYWRTMPGDSRPVMRTYTVAALREDTQELDIDFVRHADGGPAIRFAEDAALGSELILILSDRTIEGHDQVGLAWQLPTPEQEVLVIGDETALPAVTNIVAELPSHARGRVLVEVPNADDIRDLVVPDGIDLVWCVRAEGVRALSHFDAAAPELDEPADAEDTWQESTGSEGLRGWVAGESGWVKECRRTLGAAGYEPAQVSYMGYWRRGQAAVG